MVAIVWFRNDLRLTDHLALDAALKTGNPILPIFIYDSIHSRSFGEASKWWLHHSLSSLKRTLNLLKADLIFQQGNAFEILKNIAEQIPLSHIFWNRRYDAEGMQQDIQVKSYFKETNIICHSFNGSLLFEPHTIKNKEGKPFKVFSAFWKHCLSQHSVQEPIPAPTHLSFDKKFNEISHTLDSLELLPKLGWIKGLEESWSPGEENAQKNFDFFLKNSLKNYKKNRDYPTLKTSRLSPYIRRGEISVRQLWRAIHQHAIFSKEVDSECFLSELGWREFSYHTLFHHPDLEEIPLKKDFEAFPWEKNPNHFDAWTKGLTGYPIVDAGMRELWRTGYMHNRVRMITASFLVKHLLQPWQNGEKWFWDTLVDADVASNPFNWQWVAGCGADAAPYFRIFNPILQGEKFDPQGEYIRSWVPELRDVPDDFIHTPWLYENRPSDYPEPLVHHSKAREKALKAFKAM
ncbi:MAG: cryptochrome/photolyase family protein [Pseudomonadota bacterium]|jgi:deoxyribodipyrimidine photo-lyase|nr:DNA photolyase family protein [Alphaproteobacteria bacterium]